MKVCTDACILGAWFAGKQLSAQSILDIGAGTGLQMLMLAQSNATASSVIHGIELDPDAFIQLNNNISDSKWSSVCTGFLGDIKTSELPRKYDFIISNPPFFANDLLSAHQQSNAAKHSTTLGLDELFTAINQLLTPTGTAGILLPWHRTNEAIALAAKQGLHLIEILKVKQTTRHTWFRSVLHFSRTAPATMSNRSLTIKDGKDYTPAFVALMQPYYLYL